MAVPFLLDLGKHIALAAHDVFNGGADALGAARPYANQAARMLGMGGNRIDVHALAIQRVHDQPLVHQFDKAAWTDGGLVHRSSPWVCAPGLAGTWVHRRGWRLGGMTG